jgi:hypothetical protein
MPTKWHKETLNQCTIVLLNHESNQGGQGKAMRLHLRHAPHMSNRLLTAHLHNPQMDITTRQRQRPSMEDILHTQPMSLDIAKLRSRVPYLHSRSQLPLRNMKRQCKSDKDLFSNKNSSGKVCTAGLFRTGNTSLMNLLKGELLKSPRKCSNSGAIWGCTTSIEKVIAHLSLKLCRVHKVKSTLQEIGQLSRMSLAESFLVSGVDLELWVFQVHSVQGCKGCPSQLRDSCARKI